VLGVRNDGLDTVEVMRGVFAGRINIPRRIDCGAAQRRRATLHRVADGFYEWRRPADRFTYTLPLWPSRSPSPVFGSRAMVWRRATCDLPSELARRGGGTRSPCPSSFRETAVALWLDPNRYPPDAAGAVLRPLDPARSMTVREVSRRVNNANYDAADVLAAPEPRLF